jgi:phosphohistidine phosphatase
MLTPKGTRTTFAMATLMARMGCAPRVVVSSPLTRALETARIALHELRVDGDPLVTDALLPEADPEAVIGEIHPFDGDILLVGHLPHLEQLAALLIGSTAESAVLLRKSAACRLHFEGRPAGGRGTLEWLLQPDILHG